MSDSFWPRVAAIVFGIATVLLAIALIASTMRYRKAASEVEAYAAAALKAQGYKPGTYEEPRIKDAPLGTKPIITVEGEVRYPPTSKATGKTGPTQTAPSRGDQAHEPSAGRPPTLTDPGGATAPTVATSPCDLSDLDVTVKCRADVIAGPVHPWGRLVTSGSVKAWGQTRNLPEAPAGRVELQVVPTVVPPAWRLDFLAGASAGSRAGLEGGLAWTGRSRWGSYGLAEWQPASGGDPAAWRVHGGIRLRVK